MTTATKYTRVEYERRFLVVSHSDWCSRIEPYAKTIADKYLHNSRLRLRVLTESDSGQRIIKLNKKDESVSPYYCTISRILLAPNEYELFDSLPGDRLTKTRHYHQHQGHTFAVDEFAGALTGLVLCEVEADSLPELMTIAPPPFAAYEVTTDAFFTGGNLCRLSAQQLQIKLQSPAATTNDSL